MEERRENRKQTTGEHHESSSAQLELNLHSEVTGSDLSLPGFPSSSGSELTDVKAET